MVYCRRDTEREKKQDKSIIKTKCTHRTLTPHLTCIKMIHVRDCVTNKVLIWYIERDWETRKGYHWRWHILSHDVGVPNSFCQEEIRTSFCSMLTVRVCHYCCCRGFNLNVRVSMLFFSNKKIHMKKEVPEVPYVVPKNSNVLIAPYSTSFNTALLQLWYKTSSSFTGTKTCF